jgi:hypothetical protein
MVEGVISLWRVTASGQLKKDRQETFNYPMKFQRTMDGMMQMELSNDKQIISLAC